MVQVSAVIPTYNRRDWVQLAIDSVLAQRGVSVECIVVDDGSTDDTGSLLQQRYGTRIRYIRQDNQGESVARNHGAELAAGAYIAFLDSDDLWLPGKLAAQVAFLENNLDCGGVYCPAYAIDERGRPIARLPYGMNIPGSRVSLTQILQSGITASGSTLMMRAEVFRQLGGYSTTIRHGEDVDFVVRMLLRGISLGVIHQPLAQVRSHTHSQSLTMQREKFMASYRDHNEMLEFILQHTQEPAVIQAVQIARQNEAVRLLAFEVYTSSLGQTALPSPPHDLPQPITPQAYDRQIHYFTPLIYRDKQDPRAVQSFIRTLFAYRSTHSPKIHRPRQDALERLRAVIWCAGQDRRHAVFAWQQVFSNLSSQPGLLLLFAFWKLIARLIFGRLAVQLYLVKSRFSHA